MNTIRIVGLVLLAAAVVLNFVITDGSTDFLSGILVGIGIGLLVTGRLGFKKHSSPQRFENN